MAAVVLVPSIRFMRYDSHIQGHKSGSVAYCDGLVLCQNNLHSFQWGSLRRPMMYLHQMQQHAWLRCSCHSRNPTVFTAVKMVHSKYEVEIACSASLSFLFYSRLVLSVSATTQGDLNVP